MHASHKFVRLVATAAILAGPASRRQRQPAGRPTAQPAVWPGQGHRLLRRPKDIASAEFRARRETGNTGRVEAASPPAGSRTSNSCKRASTRRPTS